MTVVICSLLPVLGCGAAPDAPASASVQHPLPAAEVHSSQHDVNQSAGSHADQAAIADPSTVPDSSTVLDSSTVPQAVSFEIESTLGRVTGRVPANAGPDPIAGSAGPDPDFVVGLQRWLAGDCCRLAVVLQDVVPLHMDEERVDVWNANGLSWTVYDIGPRDGTQIVAVATVGELSIVVGGQTSFPDRPAERRTIDVVRGIAETIVLEGVN
jgi:hypothetical protein